MLIYFCYTYYLHDIFGDQLSVEFPSIAVVHLNIKTKAPSARLHQEMSEINMSRN